MENGVGTALVLEGGGFRGMFTSGVLDVLMEHGVDDFSSIWGVSAGAINAAGFRSHQIGRTMRIMLAFRDDRRFMSLWSFARTGDLAGGEFLYEDIQNGLDPCDIETFNKSRVPFFAVASDIVFGTAAYLPTRCFPDDVANVRASASMPAVSRIVEIDGHRYLDGGTTDSIPFGVALGLEGERRVEGHVPAARAVVVLTQDRSYVKSENSEAISLRSHRYDGYPFYLTALETRGARYNEQRERLWEREAVGDCLVIAPEKPVEVKVNEHDGAPLLDLYLQGRRQAEERLEEIRAFVAGE